MGKSKTGLIKAERIDIYVAEASADYPTYDKLDVASMTANQDWSSIGYTSKETPMTITSEGGEVTTLDTAEEDAVIAIAATTSRTFEIKAVQFDAETLSLAYNGTYTPTDKTFNVPTTSQPLEKRLLAVVKKQNGGLLGVGALAAISVSEDPTLAFDALSQLGLKGTVLGDNGTSMKFINIESSATEG